MDDDMSHLFNIEKSLDTYRGIYSSLLWFVKLIRNGVFARSQ